MHAGLLHIYPAPSHLANPLSAFENSRGHQPFIPATRITVAEGSRTREKIFSSDIGRKNVIYNCTRNVGLDFLSL